MAGKLHCPCPWDCSVAVSVCLVSNNLWFPRPGKRGHGYLKRKKGMRIEVGNEKISPFPFANGNPGIDCPVPFEQQPVNEYKSLSTSELFSWANEEIWKYGLRLVGIGAAFTVFVGWPVASVSVDPQQELLKCGVGAVCGGLLVVTLTALRMYLGWAYVGNRLFSATVEYEETGWYDGEVWVKPPEVLARDRLLGSYSVKPVLNRVKITLVGLAMTLVTCILLFISLESPQVDTFDSAENVSRPLGQGVYNDSSARSFEPQAFSGTIQFGIIWGPHHRERGFISAQVVHIIVTSIGDTCSIFREASFSSF